jgi:hypothetical protein
MQVDGHVDEDPEEDLATCKLPLRLCERPLMLPPDTSIEAPPSFLPQRKYCDITGLEVCTAMPPHLDIRELVIAGTIHRPGHRPQVPRQERLRAHQGFGKRII